jgi:D-threo-aldose 1-dehydrogenase
LGERLNGIQEVGGSIPPGSTIPGRVTDGVERAPLGRTGIAVSRLGIGGGSLANAAGEAGFAEVVDAAWQAGLRHFDTAAFYAAGDGERRLGAALAQRPRGSFTVSTKLGRMRGAEGGNLFDYSAAGAERAVGLALERLRLDRLDVMLIHDVIPELHGDAFEARFAEAMSGAYPVLRRLREAGVIGAIGVALRDPATALRFLQAGDFDAVMLAGGCTLLDRGAEAEFLPHAARHGIGVLVAAPFETGLLAGQARFRYGQAPPEVLARVAAMEAACARHGVPLAAAALQFPLRHAAVASVVAGHQSPAQIAQNLAWLRLPIPAALWDELATL